MAEESNTLQQSELPESRDDEEEACSLQEEQGPGQSAKAVVNGTEGSEASCKLFVGGLNRGTTDDALREYFGQFGEIESCLIKCDPLTNRSRGFGFVTFQDRSSVEKVLSSDVNHMLDERKIDPKVAVPYPKNRTRKIFVGGLPADLLGPDLTEHFGQYGSVDEVELPVDRATGSRKGFGFVSFENEETVELAMKDTFHKIGDYTVEVKRAVAKDHPQGGTAGNRGRGSNVRPIPGHVANGHGMMAAAAYGVSPPAQYAAYAGAYPAQAQPGYGPYGQMYNPYSYGSYAGYPYYAYSPFAGVPYSQHMQGQQAFTAYTPINTPESSSKYGPVRNNTSASGSGYRPY